jgi:hypothetical protein
MVLRLRQGQSRRPWACGDSRLESGVALLLSDGIAVAQPVRLSGPDARMHRSYHCWHIFAPRLGPVRALLGACINLILGFVYYQKSIDGSRIAAFARAPPVPQGNTE